jgi:hypothetical protein
MLTVEEKMAPPAMFSKAKEWRRELINYLTSLGPCHDCPKKLDQMEHG